LRFFRVNSHIKLAIMIKETNFIKGVSDINMNNVAGIIFSNLHDRSVPELTAKRTMGAIPFGGGYRMVDFPLSAMANAGIRNISVIAHHNYESLVEHIGCGADWGIPTDRGGVKIISPYITAYAKTSDELYTSRLESLKSICNNLERMKEKYVVMCDCDCVFNADITEMLEFHIKSNADVTVNTNKKLDTDENGRIRDIDQSPSAAFDLNVNMWVFSRDYLVGMVKNAVSRGYSDFACDIIGKRVLHDRFFEYRFNSDFLRIKSLADYFRVSMKLLFDSELREEVLQGVRSRNIGYTPAKIGNGASISSSVISEGCSIDGTVENSIVFRGVTVEKGAVVKNSILFPDVRISKDARLDFVIADKNTDIREGNILAGCKILPYFVGKDKII